jgi:hypothetical protein
MKKLFRERGYYKNGRVLPFAEFRPFRDLEKGITFCDGRMASVMEAAEKYASTPIPMLPLSLYREFQLNGNETLPRCNHLLFTRMPYIAGGIKIELPDLKDDEYVLWYLQDLSRLDWLKILPKLYHGNTRGMLKIIRGTTLLECQEECPLEFDGDPQGKLPLKIDLSPRKLHLICGVK